MEANGKMTQGAAREASALGSVLERIEAQAVADAQHAAGSVGLGQAPAQEPQEEPRKPVIGIVPSQVIEEKALRIPERYARAIIQSGGAPLFLPMSKDMGVYESIFPLLDGFVLPGGQDIDPVRYGASHRNSKLSDPSPDREELEHLALSYALEFDVPVLGICRGMQMINVFFGGTLFLDLADEFSAPGCRGLGRPIAHWQKIDYSLPSHSVRIVEGSKLARVTGELALQVNSMHHQGVCRVADPLRPVAFGPDGLVEAVESPDASFLLGVQWHPEFLMSHVPMRRIFEELVRQAASHHECAAAKGLHLHISREQAGGTWPAVSFADCI